MNDQLRSFVLQNARIYPDLARPERVGSIAIRDGRVLEVGNGEQLSAGTDAAIDLQGRTVLPGLIDAHFHLEQYARQLELVNCSVPTPEACIEAVQARAARLPPGTWIQGHGWDQNLWGGYGSLELLDRAIPNHPVYLTAKSLHAGWINSEAMRLAGIDRTTADPPNGRIQRDERSEATGILFESAMQLVRRLIPDPGPAELAELFHSAQQHLIRMGLVAIHDFDGPSCLEAIQLLRESQRLDLRIVKNLPVGFLPEIQRLRVRSGFGDDWIRIGNLKAFADGALGPRTAAMIEPYDAEPENRGMLLLDREQLSEIGISAAKAGFGLAVHAIGDRANHEVLEAISLLRSYEQQNRLPRRRHRIEHLQLLHRQDLGRPAELDVIASMQPVHATSDRDMAEQYWGQRVDGAYAWRAQLDAGAQLAFGSDAPVEDPNPWWGVHAAVTRSRRGQGSAWTPKQRLALADALNAYTRGPAYAAGLEAWQGRLFPGSYADLIVLEQDPYLVPPEELSELRPIGTMVDGSWRHREF